MDPLTLTNEPMDVEQVTTVAAIAVGLVFGYAAVTKLANIRRFISAIRGYRLVPVAFAPLAAGLLIASESSIALAHLIGAGLSFMVPCTLVLLSIFFVATALLLTRKENGPCLCFGAHQDDHMDVVSLVRISILWLIEGSLYLLQTVDGSMAVRRATSYTGIESFLPAALIVTLLGWLLSIPRFHRAWIVIRSKEEVR